jgi:hypothetical protein
MTLWIIQGNLGELCALQMEFAQMLMGGPRGGDDDTFDYWPNAFEMLITLTEDLIALGASDYYIGLVGAVVKSAIALNGPAEEWEAPEILNAVPNLTKLHNERQD